MLTTAVSWAATANGYLVWADPVGVLYAAPFDGKHVTGAGRPLNAQAQTTRGTRPKVALSHDGRALTYVPVQPASLARVDRAGRVQTLLAEARTYHNPRVSPDGRAILLDIADTERDVWLLDLSDTTLTRITFERTGHDAVWTPDGKRIVFGADRNNQIGVFSRNVDGSGGTDSVLVEGPQLSVHAITPDGKTGIAALVTSAAANGFDLVTLPLTGVDRHNSPFWSAASWRHSLHLPQTATGWPMSVTSRAAPRCMCGPSLARAQGPRLPERRERAGLVARWQGTVLPRSERRHSTDHGGGHRDQALASRRFTHGTF